MALDRLTKVDGTGIHTLSNIISHNINSSGIVTATKFVGPVEGSITATDATFSGNVSIAGTLTYEDVTNIDSVGIIQLKVMFTLVLVYQLLVSLLQRHSRVMVILLI